MKKRVLSVLLIAAMAVLMLAGCGKKDDEEKVVISNDGKVLNIYVWNDEFMTRVTDCYPGYEKIDNTTGKIGDVTVKWNITPNADNAYQNNLDSALLGQKKASADDRVDIFLVEADYAIKYVNSGNTVPVADLGITDADISKQFKYTQDVMTSKNGSLKGLTWQCCPAGLIYNRAIAKEVFGTDDPTAVQEYVKDWATYEQTAATLKDAGYKIQASVVDTYRVYSNNVTTKWVVDGKINVDANMKAWVEQGKRLVDAGQTNTYELWDNDWSQGFYPDGGVFCYFGPAWFIDYSMKADTEGTIANQGGWALVKGPQSYYWGGTWICAANYTDNSELVKDIMLKMTTDDTIMTSIVTKKNDFVNNKTAMEEMAKTDYQTAVLGGQNPLPIYLQGVGTIDASNMSAYDQACNEKFQKAMLDYLRGTTTYEEALKLFYDTIIEIHPDVTRP